MPEEDIGYPGTGVMSHYVCAETWTWVLSKSSVALNHRAFSQSPSPTSCPGDYFNFPLSSSALEINLPGSILLTLFDFRIQLFFFFALYLGSFQFMSKNLDTLTAVELILFIRSLDNQGQSIRDIWKLTHDSHDLVLLYYPWLNELFKKYITILKIFDDFFLKTWERRGWSPVPFILLNTNFLSFPKYKGKRVPNYSGLSSQSLIELCVLSHLLRESGLIIKKLVS